MSFLTCLMTLINISFTEPILALRVVDFGYQPEFAGFIFCVSNITYFAGCIAVIKLLDSYQKLDMMLYCTLSKVFLVTLFGPSKFFHMPNEMWLLWVGFIINGLVMAFGIVPVNPEMLESAEAKLGI